MRSAARWGMGWIALLAVMLLVACGGQVAPEPGAIVVDAAFRSAAVSRRAELLVDPTGARDLDDVRRDDAGFEPIDREVPNLGSIRDVVWVRAEIVNVGRAAMDTVIVVDYEQLDDVRLFASGPAGELPSARSGDAVPATRWPLRHLSPAFPLQLEPGTTTVWLRVATTSPMKLPITLWRNDAFAEHVRLRWVFLAAFYGLLLGLVLHNLVLFVALRRRNQLLYSLYLTSLSLFFITYNGIGFQWLWPDAAAHSGVAIPFFSATSTIALLLFARDFLETKNAAPQVDKLLKALIGASLVGCVLVPMWGVTTAMIMGAMALSAGGMALLSGVVLLMARQSRPARFFMLAHVGLGISVAAALIQSQGLLPTTWLTTHGFQAAAALEAVLLAVALADQINDMRRALVTATTELESRVEERTESLVASNRELETTLHELKEQKRQRETAEAQLQRTQKLDAMGQLAGGVAHDMNNALGAIMTSAEMLLADVDDDKQRTDLDVIVAAARHGRDLTKNLLGFARKGSIVRRVISLHEVIQNTADLLRRTVGRRITIELELEAERPWLVGDQGQLSHAIMNLCLNASQAIEERGEIVLKTFNEDERLVCEVSDDGRGMTAETLERAFEPFYTTGEQRGRTGLGLSMVYGCIQDHDGQTTLASAPGQGTKVRLELPTCDPPSAAPMPKPRAAAPSNGRERALILLVDDEALLRSATARLLRRERYDVLTAADGEEALEVFDGCDPPPALVVLDLEMPRKSGAEAFRELRARCPDQSVLLISGHTSADVEGLLADGAIGFLAKPFENDTLLAAVASAVTDPAQPTDAATAS